MFDTWPQETRPSLSPVNLHLVTVTDEMSPFLGKAEIEITLAKKFCMMYCLQMSKTMESLAWIF